MKKIGIGIIGCSGRIKGVIKGLLDCDKNVEVLALCDPDTKRTEDFKNDFAPNAKVYESDKELAKAPDIDWVAVGSWNSLHTQQAVAGLEAGKHVFCEKPLATNFADCIAIQEAYRKSGKKLMIGFTLRYSPHYRKIKKMLEDGLIGDVLSFEFNETLDFNHGGHIMCCWRRKREFTGCHILEKCCHDIDVANWMIGARVKKAASFGDLDFFKPENERHRERLKANEAGHKAYCSWPTAQGNNPFTSEKDIIDNQVGIIEYENGVRATFHTNLNAAIKERRIYILGTEGAIRGDVITGKLEMQRIGFDEKLQDFSGAPSNGHGGGDETLVKYWSKMIHEDVPSLTDIETGIESAVTCFALDEAMLENRIIDLDQYWKKLDSSE